jgi:NAD(P)-dependent dehydrogenase (short-subunit alcohol dehydrogenase family)
MSAARTELRIDKEPGLHDQTLLVIGGSSGIGLETARQARAHGAKLILTGRNRERLERTAAEINAQSIAAFDATHFESLQKFFDDLPMPVDHILLTGPGPSYSTLEDFDFERAREDIEAHLLLPLQIARSAQKKVRPGGTILFIGGTGGRRVAKGFALISALTAAAPAMTKNLALELAPVRVNLIAAGFVDTPLSAQLLGDDLETRRNHLRATLPIGRVVQPEDVAALAVHIMINTALTGATYDIDGGQQLVAA